MSNKETGVGRPDTAKLARSTASEVLRAATADDWRQKATISIPEYAEVVGVGRNTAYAAAKAGEIVTIKLRGRMLVPVSWVLRQLDGRAA